MQGTGGAPGARSQKLWVPTGANTGSIAVNQAPGRGMMIGVN